MTTRIEQMLRDNPTVTPAMLLANAKHFAKPLSTGRHRIRREVDCTSGADRGSSRSC